MKTSWWSGEGGRDHPSLFEIASIPTVPGTLPIASQAPHLIPILVFPRAALASSYRLSGLNQPKCMLSQFWRLAVSNQCPRVHGRGSAVAAGIPWLMSLYPRLQCQLYSIFSVTSSFYFCHMAFFCLKSPLASFCKGI